MENQKIITTKRGNWKKILIFGVSGCFGAIFRYLVSIFLNKFTNFPSYVNLFLINIFGVFLLSFLITIELDHIKSISTHRHEILGGFVGSFTTFSTFIIELSDMNHSGEDFITLLYAIMSILLGLVMMEIGYNLANKFNYKLSKSLKRINLEHSVDNGNKNEISSKKSIAEGK
ncbi:MAG: fluoride efflux transporter FluC [Promethearchaeota archaeon]